MNSRAGSVIMVSEVIRTFLNFPTMCSVLKSLRVMFLLQMNSGQTWRPSRGSASLMRSSLRGIAQKGGGDAGVADSHLRKAAKARSNKSLDNAIEQFVYSFVHHD